MQHSIKLLDPQSPVNKLDFSFATHTVLKRHSQLWDRADLDANFFFSLRKEFTPTWNQVNQEFRFNPRSVLLYFQLIIEKPVFKCAFAHPIMLLLSYLVKNSMDRVSVWIYKLAMKWYLMRICTS